MRLAIVLLFTVLLVACSGDEPEQDGTPSVVPPATPRLGATALPPGTPVPTIEIEAFDPTLQLTGVFRLPQETIVTHQVELPPRPRAQFAAWDGASVVVYDTETATAHDFGPGYLHLPAFGRNHLVFTSDNEVFVVDLRTMQKESLGRGVLAYFLGDEHVIINPGDDLFFAIEVTTGRRLALDSLRSPVLKSMVSQRWGGAFHGKWQDDRFAIRLAQNPTAACEHAGAEQSRCLAEVSSKWLVEDLWGLEVRLAFEANRVEPAGPVEVVIATTPVCYEANWLTDCDEVLMRLEAQSGAPGAQTYVEGTTNIFLVDLRTGEATFVATATYNAATGQWPMDWPLAANEDFVAWTESYCGQPRGLTRIFDRATGEITELSTSEWVVLADGRIGLGERGSTAILAPETFEYLAVLPELRAVTWSSDLRYAAVGQGFGRGAVCD